ncbi:MAG TPA: tripartite tricarboxylate transporter substrate binding protein [Burkholderiales bacterium]
MLRSLSVALLAVLANAASAQPYPSQPVKMISPWPPGGSVDITARLIADPMASALGGKIIIENRGGASGNIGMEAAARAKPDGYTIVINTIPLVTNVSLFDKLAWDPMRDFAPIGMVSTSPHLLVVPPKSPAHSVAELLKLARAHPGRLSYASAGVGTTFHFCAEMFKDDTRTFILHVPYRGGGPALQDTLGAQVDMSFPNLAAALAHVKGGTLRALAITSQRRSTLLPEVPTLDEVGLKGFEFTQWQAVLAPAGTPPEVIARLNRALNSAIESKDLREKFQAQAMEPFIATPEETRKFLAGELARYTRIIKSRKITAE